ncbi:hypothetical protein [Bradyrhizobium sp. RDI18]|uniref:hypothetical protein n=1 Tax=Bradyrhizobium sp. RDI18 TaxID=3367400 RepID=UPI0037145B7B
MRVNVTFLFQLFNLFPHKSVLDNITLAPIHPRRLPRQHAKRRASDMRERVGLGAKMKYQRNCPAARSNAQELRVLQADRFRLSRDLTPQPEEA